MIVGIGTDLVEVARIERSLERFGDRFAHKILSSTELQNYRSAASRSHFLAKRFAAKEAVAKALGTGMRGGVHFRLIEISHDEAGKPIVSLLSGALARAQQLNISNWHLSISDERQHALAFVVAERQ